MKHRMMSFVLAAGLAACSSPTGSTCPPTDPPTYATFGQAFVEDYCLDCHSANSTNRHGAPGDLNFDTEDEIRRHVEDIDSEAAAGPDATNTSMPEKSPNVQSLPTLEERQRFGQFLACLKSQ